MADIVNRIILHTDTTCLTWLSMLPQQYNHLCPISSHAPKCFWKTRLSMFTLTQKIALTCSHNRRHSESFYLTFFSPHCLKWIASFVNPHLLRAWPSLSAYDWECRMWLQMMPLSSGLPEHLGWPSVGESSYGSSVPENSIHYSASC